MSSRITNDLIDKLDIYLSDNYSYDLDMMNNDWTFRITFMEYEPVVDTLAEQVSRPLNSRMNDTHLNLLDKPKPVEQTVEDVEEKQPASRRFQK